VAGDRPRNASTDGVLDVVQLRGSGVVPLGPELTFLRVLHELDGHAHDVSSPPHAPVHDVTRHAVGRAPISDRAGMQHVQRAEPRELRRDVFDKPLREVVLERVAREVVERRDGDRGGQHDDGTRF
jgi:hypothetical protein